MLNFNDPVAMDDGTIKLLSEINGGGGGESKEYFFGAVSAGTYGDRQPFNFHDYETNMDYDSSRKVIKLKKGKKYLVMAMMHTNSGPFYYGLYEPDGGDQTDDRVDFYVPTGGELSINQFGVVATVLLDVECVYTHSRGASAIIKDHTKLFIIEI